MFVIYYNMQCFLFIMAILISYLTILYIYPRDGKNKELNDALFMLKAYTFLQILFVLMIGGLYQLSNR